MAYILLSQKLPPSGKSADGVPPAYSPWLPITMVAAKKSHKYNEGGEYG